MTDLQTLYKIVNDLSAEEWAELKDYLEKHPPVEPPIRDPKAPRILGLLAGGWVSADFDDELPDEFWGWDK